MDGLCLRQTALPGTTKLFADLVYHHDRVAAWYPHGNADVNAMRTLAVDYPDERRAALVAALRKRNGDSPALERLAQPGTVAVLTGQQVGLYSGPSYTIYKALTAIQLARTLSEQGRPAAPVFWLATEDHDFAEIDHVWVFDAQRQPVRLDSAALVTGDRPAGTVRASTLPGAALHAAFKDLPYGEQTADRVARAYPEGTTYGEGFLALLEDLLGGRGLLFLDPMQPEIRALGAPFLAEAFAHTGDLAAQVRARSRELEERGYHAQVHLEAESSLFFFLHHGRRRALRRKNGAWICGEQAFDPAQAAAEPESLSPNALLRPVWQDWMLPTVAIVGGPAELAYFAQSEPLYRDLLGRQPVPVSRSGFTLLDYRTKKFLERAGLQPEDCFRNEAALRERIAARLIPGGLATALAEARAETEGILERLAERITGFDPTLGEALARSRAKFLYQLDKTSRKTARESLRRNERAAEESVWLAHTVFPHRHLQERFYSILPFLASHGPDLIGRLAENIRLDCPDHQILVL